MSNVSPNSFTTRPEIEGTFGVVASTHWIATAVGMATDVYKRQTEVQASDFTGLLGRPDIAISACPNGQMSR